MEFTGSQPIKCHCLGIPFQPHFLSPSAMKSHKKTVRRIDFVAQTTCVLLCDACTFLRDLIMPGCNGCTACNC